MTVDAGRFVIRRHGKFVVVTRYKKNWEFCLGASYGESIDLYKGAPRGIRTRIEGQGR